MTSSCSVSLFKGYNRYNATSTTVPESWFRPDTGYFLFNTGIDIMENHFSGLMVVKPADNGSYRVVFITEVGIKIFDMEFFADRPMKLHYIMEAVNKRLLVKMLANDISMLLMNRIPGLKPEIFNKKNSDDVIYRYNWDGRKNYYHVSDARHSPYKVIQVKCLHNKVKADIFGNEEAGIDSVRISHYNYNLTIDLNKIQE